MAQENGNFEYDLVTIGAGSGGVRASRVSAGVFGAKVAIIELPFGFVSSDDIGGAGGTCVIRGCVPKKLLVYSSMYRGEIEDAKGFGWDIGEPKIDWQKLIAAKGKEIERLNKVYNTILGNAGVEMIEGKGGIIDPHTVEVQLSDGTTRQLKTKNILVATGSKALKLDIPGAEHGITSDDALVLDELPGKRVAIIGAGYIAVEFAGIFSGCQAEVHLCYRKPYPLTGFDEECRAAVAENLQKRGVTTHPGCTPKSIEKLPDGTFRMRYEQEGKEAHMDCDLVMFATGRAPKTQGLGLERAGVESERKGAVKVDAFSRTTCPSVWAIGDVTDRVNLTPVAIMEGKAFAATCFGGKPTHPDYEFIASAVFCQPPLATVGLSEEQAVEKLAGNVDVYVSRFKPMKNTLSGRDERTLMKIIVHADTDKVVGMHMVGPDAPEILQGFAVALKCGATKAQFDTTVGVHPSAAEEFVTMSSRTRRLQGKAKL